MPLNELLLHATTWMDLTNIISSKRNQYKGLYTVLFWLDKTQKQLKLINAIKIQAQKMKKVKFFIQISLR